MIKMKLFWVVLVVLSVVACKPKSEYEQVKEKELSSGKVVEELFLDLRFGMPKKEFFGTCWEYNKKGLLTNGSHYLQVQYQPVMPSGKRVNMFFYPEFEEDKLFFMPMEFIYLEWFPGNEEFSNDKLMDDVIGLLESWYGEGFFEVANKNKTIRAMVKIDGNRLIRVFKKDISYVRAEILDLRVKDITDLTKK